MENPSFRAAFEQMWQYILIKFNSYVPKEDFNSHASSENNPHEVTAEQAGALPITGGVMNGELTLNGIVLTEGVDYGYGDPGGGVKGQLYFKRVT